MVLNGGGTFEVWWDYHYDKHQILNTNASYSSLLGRMGNGWGRKSASKQWLPSARADFYLAKLEQVNVGINELAIDPQKIHAHSTHSPLAERLFGTTYLAKLAGRTDCVRGRKSWRQGTFTMLKSRAYNTSTLQHILTT